MDLDELDDDVFGELYAKVEVQASYAIENVDENIDEMMSSDSSDDLNIVLNNDTDLGRNNEEESESSNLQFKNIELRTPAVHDKSKDDGYNHHFIANGCNFSFPRSRTIFDVNIDSFKYKPWKHPGVDITDFFNFGFDEDTWKQYCNNLDLKAGSEKIPHPVQRQSGMISGRAIQVEECAIERQPSTNTWGPLDRDSDVVIKIALQDDLEEDLLTSSNEGVDQTEVDSEGTLLDEERAILCLSASEDELSSPEGDDEELANYAAESGRSDKQSPISGFVSKHLEIDSGNSRSIDADVVCRGKWTDAVPIGEEMDTDIKLGGSAERRFSHAAPSILKPRLNQGNQSPHSVTPPGFCSHRGYGFDTDADSNKSSNKAKLKSPNYLLEKRDSMTYDCYLSDDSKKYGLKSKRRKAFQTDLSFHGNKPIYVDEDASHLPAKEWFGDSRDSTINQKHNGLGSHTIKRNSYYKTSTSFPDCGGHKLSKCDSKDHYMKRSYRKGSSSEYDLDENNRENINVKKTHVVQRPRFDHKEGRHDHLIHQRRHAVQYMETKPHGRYRQWQPKSDCYLGNEGGNQWKTEKHDWQFRKDVEHGDFLEQSNYKSSLTQGDHRKPVSSVVCIRDSVQHTGYEHLSYSRRVKNSGWRSGRCDWAFNGLDEMQYGEYDDEKRGCTRFWSHDSQMRPPSTSRQGLQGGSSPRDGINQTHFRNRRNSSWAEKSYKNDHLGNYCFSDADVNMRNLENQDCFVRRRENEHCGVSHWNDEQFISQRKDNEVLPSGRPYPYKKHQSLKSIYSQHGLNHFAKHTNHSNATQGRFKISRGHLRGHFCQKSNVFRSGNYGNAQPQFRSSIDSYLVGVDRKYTGRSFRGGKMCNVRNEYIEDDNCMKLKTHEDSNVYYPVKGNWGENLEVYERGKFSNVEHNESEDIEEGQILSEELMERAEEEINLSEDLRQIGENTMDGNEASKGLENPRLREILAKMERRRERFKRRITLEKDTEKATLMALHTDLETCNSNLQRPVRKRRWDGSPHMVSVLR